jgi:hypothetical protein
LQGVVQRLQGAQIEDAEATASHHAVTALNLTSTVLAPFGLGLLGFV